MSGKYIVLVYGLCALSLMSVQTRAQESAPAESAPAAPAAPAESVATLSLVCPGDGTVSASETRQTQFHNDYNYSQSATANTEVRKDVAFKSTAYIEINGNKGRVRIPAQLTALTSSPTFNGLLGKPKEEWFDIQELALNEREITGKIRVNMFNQPKLRIDRLSGIVTLANNSDSFNGQCERAENVKPKF